MANIVVELPDGNTAEFPEGTPQDVMEKSLLSYMQTQAEAPPDMPAQPPAGAAFQQTPPTSFWEEAKQEIPAMAGGILGPMAIARTQAFANLPTIAQRGLQVAAAGVGGALGEAGQVGGETLLGSENAPKTPEEAAKRIGMAGAEQAAFEGIGQLAVKVAQGIGRAIPHVSEVNQYLRGRFQELGGELTPAQLTDSWWIKQLDSLSRGSLTGSGIFKTRDVANEEAFKRMESELTRSIAKGASSELSDQQLGDLFITTVRDGRAAHSAAAGRMYAELDSLAPNTPVDVSGVKQVAADTLQRLSKISGVGAGEVDTTLLRNVMNLPDSMMFQDAHYLRSSILAMGRDMENVVGAGRAKKVIADMSESISKSMDKSAMEAGPDVAKLYAKTNKFWKQGKETFDNDFIAGLVLANKKNPERIGEAIFREGNVTEVMQAKKAIKAAAKMDKTFKSEEIWNQMQAGYLQNTLSRFSTSEGVVDAGRLAKAFVNPKSRRTLQAAFTKEQRDKIIEFAQIGEKLQKAPEGGLGLVMNIAQAGTVVAAAQAPFTGYQVFDPRTAAAVLFGPRVLAHMLTKPTIVDVMIAATKTPANSLEGGKIAAKLVAEYRKIAADMDEPVLEQYYGEDQIQMPPSRY